MFRTFEGLGGLEGLGKVSLNPIHPTSAADFLVFGVLGPLFKTPRFLVSGASRPSPKPFFLWGDGSENPEEKPKPTVNV